MAATLYILYLLIQSSYLCIDQWVFVISLFYRYGWTRTETAPEAVSSLERHVCT